METLKLAQAPVMLAAVVAKSYACVAKLRSNGTLLVGPVSFTSEKECVSNASYTKQAICDSMKTKVKMLSGVEYPYDIAFNGANSVAGAGSCSNGTIVLEPVDPVSKTLLVKLRRRVKTFH